jgi:hypothetical protein
MYLFLFLSFFFILSFLFAATTLEERRRAPAQTQRESTPSPPLRLAADDAAGPVFLSPCRWSMHLLDDDGNQLDDDAAGLGVRAGRGRRAAFHWGLLLPRSMSRGVP